ncbi:4330_t:CDS:2 [Ambispora gerdemannii]|uniref:4330_t:CDS:1 n=1 Tax=Ambispora gerdemannii TaxID=144530 RepID=A0A9N9DHA5_9GLOM|nr:4330_t:CDS:2 [Ambispora gerdemannii]
MLFKLHFFVIFSITLVLSSITYSHPTPEILDKRQRAPQPFNGDQVAQYSLPSEVNTSEAKSE